MATGWDGVLPHLPHSPPTQGCATASSGLLRKTGDRFSHGSAGWGGIGAGGGERAAHRPDRSPARRLWPPTASSRRVEHPPLPPKPGRYLWGTGRIRRDAPTLTTWPSFPLSPRPRSLPRTPELLAQGPVSLTTPEKHPRAL
uniref:Uncharacterized protein n=1 Tax=Ornithorhynchus anatinus TaxID=9258 RepID=A0A6I8NJN7_ORNAN